MLISANLLMISITWKNLMKSEPSPMDKGAAAVATPTPALVAEPTPPCTAEDTEATLFWASWSEGGVAETVKLTVLLAKTTSLPELTYNSRLKAPVEFK